MCVGAFLLLCRPSDQPFLTGDLYRTYLGWCGRSLVPPVGRKKFGRDLVQAGHFVGLRLDGRTCVWLSYDESGVGPMLVLPVGLHSDDVVALTVVAKELARQRGEEGHSPENDDRYPPGELETAGGEFLSHAGYYRRGDFPPGIPSDSWPWDAEHWKPKSPMRDAVRGTALGLAGIARRLRAGEAVGG